MSNKITKTPVMKIRAVGTEEPNTSIEYLARGHNNEEKNPNSPFFTFLDMTTNGTKSIPISSIKMISYGLLIDEGDDRSVQPCPRLP